MQLQLLRLEVVFVCEGSFWPMIYCCNTQSNWRRDRTGWWFHDLWRQSLSRWLHVQDTSHVCNSKLLYWLPLNGGSLAEVISNGAHDTMMTSPCFLASFALNHYVGHRKFTGLEPLQSLGFVSELNIDLWKEEVNQIGLKTKKFSSFKKVSRFLYYC